MMDFSEAKVGDRVWSLRIGWGEITDIHIGAFFALKVEFNKTDVKKYARYTLSGRLEGDDPFQELHWNEMTLSPVQEGEGCIWCLGRLSRDDGRLFCHRCGRKLYHSKSEEMPKKPHFHITDSVVSSLQELVDYLDDWGKWFERR